MIDRHVAIAPWGHTLDEFLDSIEISLDDYCHTLDGGWLFNYIRALRTAGVESFLVFVSDRMSEVTWRKHHPSGTELCLVPSTAAYRRLRRWVRHPYRSDPAPGSAPDSRLRRRCRRLVHDVLPYLATPARAIAQAVTGRPCHAILCQEYEYARFDALVRLGHRRRLPVFATFQGGDWQASRLERFFRPRSLRLCSGLIIGPTAEAARVRRRYGLPAHKLASIPNPVDLPELRPGDHRTERKDLGLPPDALIVLSHGRIDLARKGLDVLLAAWTAIAGRHPGARLVLIGRGDDSSRLRAMIDRQPESGIQFIDTYISDRDRLHRYLRVADGYVLASRHEGFPVAPLEAAAWGLPVIMSAVAAATDMFPGGPASGALVIPVGDRDALSQALDQVIADAALRRELGAAARRRAADFSFERIGACLRQFLFDPARNISR